MAFDEFDHDRPTEETRPERWSTEEDARAEERRLEYIAEALDEAAPLDATMGMVSARLLAMNAYAFNAFEAGLEQLGASPDSFHALKPMIDAGIKTANMLERLTSFQERRKLEARRARATYRPPHNAR